MGSGASKKEAAEGNSHTKEKKILLKSLSGHTGGINCMDIYDTTLLTGSDDRTARIWNLITFECRVALEGHHGYISSCKLWKDNYALTGSSDKTIRKWNCASGNCILKLEQHSGIINRLLVYGHLLFSSSYDGTAICWRIRSGEVFQIYTGHSKSILPIVYIEMSERDSVEGNEIEKSSDAIVTGSMDKTARLWNVSSATALRIFRGHSGAVLCLSVDANNSILFTGSSDNTIRKWNLSSGAPLKVFKGHEGSIICLQLHHRLLYSASVDATARCWVAEFGDTTRKYGGHNHMVSDMKYYCGTVYTGSGDSCVRAFDAKSGSLKKTFKGHKFPINCLLPFGDTLLSASYDGTVKVWNIQELVQKNIDGSNMSFDSSLRSTANIQIRRTSDSASESESAVRSSKSGSNIRVRSGVSRFEITNEIVSSKSRLRNHNHRSSRVAPASGRSNGNNNSNHHREVEFGYITEKLRNMKDVDDETLSSKSSRLTVSSGHFSRTNSSSNSLSFSKREQDGQIVRTNPSLFVKRNSSDSFSKRSRTDSSLSGFTNNPDTSLVDEELQILSGIETSSNTSGYRTADNNSPATPLASSSEKPKSRQKSSVSFSPDVSMRDNSWDSKNYRNSRIPTSANSLVRHQRDRRNSNRSLKSSSGINWDSRLSATSLKSQLPVTT